MSVLILPNTFGAYATTQATGTAASGFKKTDLIAGPRSTRVQTTTAATNHLGYESTSDVEISHVVVARADWLLTRTGCRVQPSERDSGGTWHTTAAFDLNPVGAGDLIGITSQDFVSEIAQTYQRGLRLVHTPITTNHPMLISKLYGSMAVDLGAPGLGVEFEPLPPDTLLLPPLGMIPYAVEGRFGLIYEGISAADVATFKAIPELLNWPMFLYDENGDIWEHQLEHVVIESYTHTLIDPGLDNHRLTITFLRLKHYP